MDSVEAGREKVLVGTGLRTGRRDRRERKREREKRERAREAESEKGRRSVQTSGNLTTQLQLAGIARRRYECSPRCGGAAARTR